MAVPCTACQPSWSTPTQCIHCGAQAASFQPAAAAAKPTREAGICFGFVVFSIALFTAAAFTFLIVRSPLKGLNRGRRRRRSRRRRGGQGSLTEDGSQFHPVAARRRGGCRHKEEEKQLPSQHLLQAAEDPPPPSHLLPRSPLRLILEAFDTFLEQKAAAAAAACPLLFFSLPRLCLVFASHRLSHHV